MEVPCNTCKISNPNPNKRRKNSSNSQPQRRVADWSSIPGDILCFIANKIESIDDYIKLCAVCRDWYLFATDFYNLEKKSHFVTYMFGINPDPGSKLAFRSYSASKKIVIDLPEAAGRRCWGSQFGWLVTFCPIDLQFNLLNPFSGATIPLPPLNAGIHDSYDSELIEAFLPVNPDESPDNCFVFVVFTHKRRFIEYRFNEKDYILVFSKPGGDNVWSHIEGPSYLSDIVYYKGNFYGFKSNYMSLVLIQIQPDPRATELFTLELVRENVVLGFSGRDLEIESSLMFPKWDFHIRHKNHSTKKYLVVLRGELCLVVRYTVGYETPSAYFQIFKINLCTNELTRVWSLDDHCLFLGNNSFACKAISLSNDTLDKLEHRRDNFTSNCIFYTLYDKIRGHYWSYLPNEQTWLIKRSDHVYYGRDSPTTYPPLWITPSISFRRLEEFDVQGRRINVDESRLLNNEEMKSSNL